MFSDIKVKSLIIGYKSEVINHRKAVISSFISSTEKKIFDEKTGLLSDIRLKALIIGRQFFLHTLFDLIKKFKKKTGLFSDIKMKSLIIGRQLFHHLLAELSKNFR